MFFIFNRTQCVNVLFACLLAGSFSLPLQTTQAAGDVVVVANTNDAGAGSLRNAIASAVPGDQIAFDPGVTGVITLTTGELVIDKSLTINGPGAAVLAISGNGASRVMSITAGANVTIAGLTLQNGYSAGQNGGGIYNAGVFTLTSSLVVSNATTTIFPGPGTGGGIFNAGTITILSSTLKSNASSAGGGLGNTGSATITATQVLSNFVMGIGGGVYNTSMLNTTTSTLRGNFALDGGGGGLYNAGNAVLSRSLLFDNVSDGPVGGGAIYNSNSLRVTGSTISGNRATTGGTPNTGGGGAIAQTTSVNPLGSASTSLDYSTVVSNTATSPISDTAGIWVASGSVILSNSILAYHGNRQNYKMEQTGLVMSIGYNMSDGTLIVFVPVPSPPPTDIFNVDPQVGPLSDEGGDTLVHPLLPGSPAINRGANNNCPSVDQRGVARPQAGVCDIGAYERIYTSSWYFPFMPVQ